MKLQTAMEYLTTYGWAILIIAVVLAVLFGLGVFNPSNLAPRAQAGACYVQRPNGPYSTLLISLQGVCASEEPQYVAEFGGTGGSTYFPANTIHPSYIALPDNMMGSGSFPAFTYAAWIKTAQPFAQSGSIIGLGDAGFQWGYSGTLFLHQCNSGDSGVWFANSINDGNWHFVAITYNYASSNTLDFYMDSQAIDGSTAVQPSTGPSRIGMINCYGYTFNGSMSNVQLYNASLSANQIDELYMEGIGGGPVDLQNLVGWWPLNGDTYDYSGNNNNGAPTNITYSLHWTSGYTAP